VAVSAVIPEAHEHLSFLMGADAITDDDLVNVAVKILERYNSAARGLLVPAASLCSALVRERLSAGFCNVGRQEILFIFKLPDGTVKEVALSEPTSSEIAELSVAQWGPNRRPPTCRATSQQAPFYSEVIAAFYASESR
jgi:hypothetical protein